MGVALVPFVIVGFGLLSSFAPLLAPFEETRLTEARMAGHRGAGHLAIMSSSYPGVRL
ncbi:hypothetical protein LX32DRAFT_641610 [Colletotrichum zoysiae]|uniref:Uncharacterized protein n=1 Tax=Colletotrichum zoysiae TaxID=1216348 RepID=A0AAD9HF00_9PEZI|nr:hypothetical protein LX32DRAFT_641610 [Colletotrichum zoysiae]